jgi:membrane protease YdiL (CAAX protease family)
LEIPNPLPPVPPEEFTALIPSPVDPLSENPPWNFIDVLLIAGFAFLSQVLLIGVAMAVAHSMARFHKLSPPDLATNAVVLVPAELGGYFILIVFMALFLKGKYGARLFSAIRWNLPSMDKAAIALGGGVAFAIFSDVLSSMLSRWIPKSLPIEELFRDTSSAYAIALFGIFVAPFVEELFFRGLLYPVLARGLGVTRAIVLTSVAFAAIHSPQLAHAWVPLAVILLFSVLLTVVRDRTKSVAMTTLIHMGYNATLFAQLFLVTQGFKHMERA